MANAKSELNEAVQEVGKHAKGVVDDVKEQAKAVAEDAKQSVKSEVTARTDAARNAAAGEVGNVAAALRRAADESRSGSAQERTFGQIANTLADVSDTIGNKDLGTVVADAGTFARKHPVTFLAGAALAGFALSRFVKASERQDAYGTAYDRDTDPDDVIGRG